MNTLARRLQETSGRGPNFDVVRLIAAACVLISHAFPITAGEGAFEPVLWLSGGRLSLGSLAVDVFFATSGFLVAASAERSKSLLSFSWKRAIRIMPALTVTVLLTAFVLGPIFTNNPMYFSASQTYKYFLNLIFITQYNLPGVFGNHPYPDAVNGSLWTLRFEITCYIALALAVKLGLHRHTWAVIATLMVCIAGAQLLHGSTGKLSVLYDLLELGSYFVAGVALYLLRDRVPFSGYFAAAAIMVGAIAMLVAPLQPLLPLALPFFVIWAGMSDARIHLPGDYSYGLYLWAFPIQQMLIEAIPEQSWMTNVALSLPIALTAGALSWHLIERPALRLKSLPSSAAFSRLGSRLGRGQRPGS